MLSVLGLSCRPCSSGNTEILPGAALGGADEEGVEVELFSLAGREVKGCDGCNACLRTE